MLALWVTMLVRPEIDMKFCRDIHGAQRMNLNKFGDPLSFPIAPPYGQIFNC